MTTLRLNLSLQAGVYKNVEENSMQNIGSYSFDLNFEPGSQTWPKYYKDVSAWSKWRFWFTQLKSCSQK